MPTTIFVCDTCRHSREDKIGPDGRTGGDVLAEAIETLAEHKAEVQVKRQPCLMGCDRHCNTAITAPGKLTYVLGMFTPTDASAEAIVEYAEAHAASETGRVPFKEWPQGVRGHFVARIPSLGDADAG
ncbi:MAG: DUF1636 domain-containing protein [Pseudomonadota bacterium]